MIEGGNVFKDSQGIPQTQRINQTDVKTTVQWLEQVTGLDLIDNMLGSTGLKPTSGDIDLAVDANAITKDALAQKLTQWTQSHKLPSQEYVKKSGISVHFKTPINGNPTLGHVQTDFMFLPDMTFGKFILRAGVNSKFKGVDRNVLINSIGKVLGFKINQNLGLMNRETNQLVTSDPDQIAKLLLGPSSSRSNLDTVESILLALKSDPKKDIKLQDFRDYMTREGRTLEESDVHFLARLRDRLVNQGMQVIVEGARIEHPEDMVFDSGSRGALSAIETLESLAANGDSVTVKWDGKPAIIFGRNEQGQFVLTDKSGFTARGYNGLFTSPDQLAAAMNLRSGERSDLINMYRQLWTPLSKMIPGAFRGYLQGDLLYVGTPQKDNGSWVFTPNTVTYSVDQNSDLGRQIAGSMAAIALHTYIPAPGAAAKPLENLDFLIKNPSILILGSKFQNAPKIKINQVQIEKLKNFIKSHGAAIDRLFNPQTLRNLKIVDLPSLLKSFINNRVRIGNFDNLISEFQKWAQGNVSVPKFQRLQQYLEQEKTALQAAFIVFGGLLNVKNSIVSSLDQTNSGVKASIAGQPGHEGYVATVGDNTIKLVDRLKFSRANFARNNPTT